MPEPEACAMNRRCGQLGWLGLSLLVMLLDLASKGYVEDHLSLYQRIEALPGLLDWTLAYNTGAAFSFLAGHSGWQRWLFAAIAIGTSVLLVVWLRRLRPGETGLAIALALVLGGALGNLYDRITLGHVIDFILVHWQERWFFPAFNLADTAITFGAILLALDMFRSPSSGESVHD